MTDVLDVLMKLPRECFTVLPSNKRLVIGLKRGMRGYIPCREFESEAEAAAMVERLNADLSVTPDQLLAMECGSMAGFDVPGADPDRWAELREQKAARDASVRALN